MTATQSKPRTKKPAAETSAPAQGTLAPLEAVASVVAIPRERLHPGKYQNRDLFDAQRIAELAASIAAVGIEVPLSVRDDGDGTYSIIAGERRWRAAEIAGLDTLPCIVKDRDDIGHATETVLENLQRENLTPIEEARGFRTLVEVGQLTPDDIAPKIGRAVEYIRDSLKLLGLPERVQGFLHQGVLVGKEGEENRPLLKLSRSQGLALARLHAPDRETLTIKIAEQALVNGIPAASLASEERLLNVYDTVARAVAPVKDGLTKENARTLPIYAIPYQSPVLESNCRKCPFGLFRGEPGGYGRHFCLRPSHYLELLERKKRDDAAAVEKAQQAAQQAMIEAGKDASSIRPLASYPPGSYIRFNADGTATDKAAGCTQACPCRLIASDKDGQPVTICCDPSRFKKLKTGETRAVNKDRRTDAKRRVEEVATELDVQATAEPGYSDRELRLVALAALSSITAGAKKIAEAGRHVAPYLGTDTLFEKGSDYSPNLLRKVGAETLAGIPVGALVRFAAEALVRKDLLDYADFGSLGMNAAAYRPLEATKEETETEAEEPQESAPAPAIATPAWMGALVDAYAAAQTLIDQRQWLPQSAIILLEGDDGCYWALDADARAVAPALGNVAMLTVGRFDAVQFTAEELPAVRAALVGEGGETILYWPRLGQPVVEDANGTTTVPPAGAGDDLTFDPEDPEIFAAYERRDWAYQVLADNGVDATTMVVLHEAANGAWIAFGEDANYLAADYGYPLEEGPEGLPCSMIGPDDTEAMQQGIVDRDRFVLVIVPRQGPALRTVAPQEEGDENADGAAFSDEGEEPDAGEDLEDGLAALEALAAGR